MDVPSSITQPHSQLHCVDETSLSPPTSLPATPSVMVSVLSNANNARFKNSIFSITTNNYNTYNSSPAATGLDLLYNFTAPNAIVNSGGRDDEVRCHPGTREEIIDLVERSLVQKCDGPRMLWVSGPAGAGKSAIMQTVAERCEELGVPHANFFFFRTDSSRADTKALVATLVHQIIQLYPFVAHSVAAILSSNPILLQMGLQKQFDALLQQIFPPGNNLPPSLRPIALLIDGLDECDSENKTAQRQILLALDKLVVQKGAYFRVVVASRVEPQIAMAFKQLRSQVDSIFLDEKYSPKKDIRIFVEAEFEKIKSTHYLAHTLRPDWPSDADIDAIVSKSSGQFIFAATVMRFIAQSPASPVLSLKRVRGIAPPAKTTPFAHLDAVYSYILGQVDDFEAAKNILAIRLVSDTLPLEFLKILVEAYEARFTGEVVDSCISELCSLVYRGSFYLEFFHTSFLDFLKDKTRAGHYHIDMEAFCRAAIPIWWAGNQKVIARGFSADELDVCRAAFQRVHQPTPAMTAALMEPHPELLYEAQNSIADSSGWYGDYIHDIVNDLYRIYAPHDLQSFAKMMQTWARRNQLFKRYLTPHFLESGEVDYSSRNL